MTSDLTYELRIYFRDADGQSAFEIKEEVMAWLALHGESSFVEGALDGDTAAPFEATCFPISLYGFDRAALAALRYGLEATFHNRVLCAEHQLANETWQQSWNQDFDPIETQHFIIVPSLSEVVSPGDKMPLRIHPGVAFGDSHHETTQLCLSILESTSFGPLAGKRLLDVGTGTGILAIAAKLLGWDDVTATDISADAILAGTENAAANGVAIEFHRGSFPLGAAPFDVIIANIFGHVLRGMATDLVERLGVGGWLVLSGLIEEEREQMLHCYERLGLKEVGCETKNGWMAMVLRK